MQSPHSYPWPSQYASWTSCFLTNYQSLGHYHLFRRSLDAHNFKYTPSHPKLARLPALRLREQKRVHPQHTTTVHSLSPPHLPTPRLPRTTVMTPDCNHKHTVPISFTPGFTSRTRLIDRRQTRLATLEDGTGTAKENEKERQSEYEWRNRLHVPAPGIYPTSRSLSSSLGLPLAAPLAATTVVTPYTVST
ncbi:hypothetical protein E4T56_gene492 [Termitomyces sp. T112]|nr:hypothetical protein E4T56_gene492 [Termitomyces sp. T112]